MNRRHGGDVAAFQEKFGQPLLDFSANVSPLGTPPAVRAAAADALGSAAAYPDPYCRELRSVLSEQTGVPAEWILCGNGASDLIFRLTLALRPRSALVPVPAFSEYEVALRLAGCAVDFLTLREEEGFLLSEEVLGRITEQTELLFLCQPNNPTGRTTDPALLRKILARCGECGTMLVLDECFLGFLDDPARFSLLPALSRNRLLILRAFTKFHGLAGLRLGSCFCADPGLLSEMAEAGPPWPVSCAAQAAGIAALRESAYGESLRRLIRQERPVLRQSLAACGCRVIPGEANFLLFFCEDRALCEKLLQHGILIRNCSNFRGLGEGWYRTAIRTHDENERLIQAVREVKNP